MSRFHATLSALVLASAAALSPQPAKAAPAPAASPSPETSAPASASASPAATSSPTATSSPGGHQSIPVDGVDVSIHDFAVLFADVLALYLPFKGPHPTAVIVTKKPADMPAVDPMWHYAGSTTKDNEPVVTVWLSNQLPKDETVAAMQTAGVLGLLDSGAGGASWQAVYAKAKAADLAQGPDAKDPWKNRKYLAERLNAAFNVVLSK